MDELLEDGDNQCSHIIHVSQNQQNTQNSQGNLYLSSVFVISCKNYFKQKQINCIFSIIDAHTYNYYKIKDYVKELGIKYHKWINLQDNEKVNIFPYLNQSHQYIKQMLKIGNIVVHCHAGVSRSSSLVLAYLIKQFGWDYQYALQFLQQKRSIVDPNDGFVECLKKFEKVARINNSGNVMQQQIVRNNN